MSRRRGRPRRLEQYGPRSPLQLWRRGERLKRAYPALRLADIARYHLGVHESTFRRWRHEFLALDELGARADFMRALVLHDLGSQ